MKKSKKKHQSKQSRKMRLLNKLYIKKHKKTILIVIIAILSLLSITATYAWISLQRRLEVVFLTVRIEAAEQLEISLDGENWTNDIDIKDMNQLYGTYNGGGENIFQARNGDQRNYIPTAMSPVSTVGTLSNGNLVFVIGKINGNTLTNIVRCSEDDVVKGASAEAKESNNQNHPYLAFDMYLKNLSRISEGEPETLQLNIGSSVTADEEKTGLEFGARVGFVVYDITTGLDATGQTVRALPSSNNDKVGIWEPNYKSHTTSAVRDDKRISSTLQDFETYAVKDNLRGTNYNSELTEEGLPVRIQDITDESDPALQNIYTNKPVQVETIGDDNNSTQLPATTELLPLMQTDGTTPLTIKPNQITKVRVYVWLEGQDPDCVELASLGKILNVNIRLTRESRLQGIVPNN